MLSQSSAASSAFAVPLTPTSLMPRPASLAAATPATDRLFDVGPAADQAWFPSDHLFTAASSGARTRELLGALDGQARLLDDLLAACAAGAATMPPSMLTAIQVAAAALAAARGEPSHA